MMKFKKKDGISTVFFAVFTIFFVAFLALVLDIGKGYMYRQQFQAIADSAALAGANFGSEVVESIDGGDATIRINEKKAKDKVNELIKKNFEGLPVTNYQVIYNMDNKLSRQKQNILYGAAVLRVEVVADIKPFIGKNSITVRSVSMTRLTKASTSSGVKDHNIKISNTRIQIYNKNNQLILDEKLE